MRNRHLLGWMQPVVHIPLTGYCWQQFRGVRTAWELLLLPGQGKAWCKLSGSFCQHLEKKSQKEVSCCLWINDRVHAETGTLLKRRNSQEEGINAGYEVLSWPVLFGDVQQGLMGPSLALAVKGWSGVYWHILSKHYQSTASRKRTKL